MGKSKKGPRKGKPLKDKKHPFTVAETIRWLLEIAEFLIELVQLFK